MPHAADLHVTALIDKSTGKFKNAENNQWNKRTVDQDEVSLSVRYLYGLLSECIPFEIAVPKNPKELAQVMLFIETFQKDNPFQFHPEIMQHRMTTLAESCRTWEAIIDSYHDLMALYLNNATPSQINYFISSIGESYIAKDITKEDFNRAQELLLLKYEGAVDLTGNQLNAYKLLAHLQGFRFNLIWSGRSISHAPIAALDDPKIKQDADLKWRCEVAFHPQTKSQFNLFKPAPTKSSKDDFIEVHDDFCQLIASVRQLDPNLKSFELDWRKHQALRPSNPEYIAFLQALPRNLMHFYLGEPALYFLETRTQEVVDIALAYPRKLETFDLRFYDFFCPTVNTQVVFTAAPPVARRLLLSGNNRRNIPSVEAAQKLAHIPPQYKTLWIEFKLLERYSDLEFRDILQNLPKNITTLDLNATELHQLPPHYLNQLRGALSAVRFLKLHHSIIAELTKKQIDKLVKIAPNAIITHRDESALEGLLLKKYSPKEEFNPSLYLYWRSIARYRGQEAKKIRSRQKDDLREEKAVQSALHVVRSLRGLEHNYQNGIKPALPRLLSEQMCTFFPKSRTLKKVLHVLDVFNEHQKEKNEQSKPQREFLRMSYKDRLEEKIQIHHFCLNFFDKSEADGADELDKLKTLLSPSMKAYCANPALDKARRQEAVPCDIINLVDSIESVSFGQETNLTPPISNKVLQLSATPPRSIFQDSTAEVPYLESKEDSGEDRKEYTNKVTGSAFNH